LRFVSKGSSPDRLLLWTKMCTRLWILQKLTGISPRNRLKDNSRSSNLLQLPMDEGIVPDNWLP
jgi:hypothetical protein